MSLFKVDHSQAGGGGGFEPLPEGEYEVVITETKVDASSEKKTPYVGMTMTVRDEADINPVGRKRKVFHNMYYTPKTVGQFQTLFKVLMFGQGEEFETLEEVAKAIKGCCVRLKLRHEKYTSNTGEEKTAERVHYFMQSQKPLRRIEPTNDVFAGNDIMDDDLPF